MGQFSWFTQDTKTQIFNDWDQHGDRQTIHMVDPRDGHDYKEEGYEGYGVFGGRDFYELLADINKDIILKQNVKNYQDYDREVLKHIITGERLSKMLFQFKGMNFNEVKLFCMDLDYRGSHQANKDGSWPIQKLEDFDEWYKNQINKEIDDQLKTDHDYLKLYSKKFEDLTEDDINDKRQDGIDLWFAYIEPENWRPAFAVPELPRGVRILSPILVEDYDKWKRYENSHPESDPDQGWHMQEDEDSEEEELWR